MSIAPGTRLGPYEILSPLGAGGMGEVYRARDTRLERTVAIKVLPDHLSKDEDARQRFEREARTISSLSHPHICALYDVGSQEGVEYLVMELLEGETLGERLANGALPIEQVLRYGIEMAAALEKAQHFGAGALAAGQSIDLLHRSGPSAAVGRFRPGFAPGRNTDSTRRPVAGFSPEYVIESLGISPNGSKLTISTGNEFATIMLAEGVPGPAPPVRNLRTVAPGSKLGPTKPSERLVRWSDDGSASESRRKNRVGHLDPACLRRPRADPLSADAVTVFESHRRVPRQDVQPERTGE